MSNPPAELNLPDDVPLLTDEQVKAGGYFGLSGPYALPCEHWMMPHVFDDARAVGRECAVTRHENSASIWVRRAKATV